jgi:hypothetical protein
MGRTYAAKRWTLLKIEEQPFEYSREVQNLNLARVKAQEEVQKVWWRG